MKNAETFRKYHELAINFLDNNYRNQEILQKIKKLDQSSDLEKQLATLINKELRKEEKEILEALNSFSKNLETICTQGHKTKDVKENAELELKIFTKKTLDLITRYDQEIEEIDNIKSEREILEIRSEL